MNECHLVRNDKAEGNDAKWHRVSLEDVLSSAVKPDMTSASGSEVGSTQKLAPQRPFNWKATEGGTAVWTTDSAVGEIDDDTGSLMNPASFGQDESEKTNARNSYLEGGYGDEPRDWLECQGDGQPVQISRLRGGAPFPTPVQSAVQTRGHFNTPLPAPRDPVPTQQTVQCPCIVQGVQCPTVFPSDDGIVPTNTVAGRVARHLSTVSHYASINENADVNRVVELFCPAKCPVPGCRKRFPAAGARPHCMRKHIADCQAQEVRRLASEAAADVQLQQLQGTVGSQNSDISTPLSAPPSPEVEPEPNLLPRNYPVAQPPPLDDENDLGSDLVGARFWKEPLGSCTVVATGTYLFLSPMARTAKP